MNKNTYENYDDSCWKTISKNNRQLNDKNKINEVNDSYGNNNCISSNFSILKKDNDILKEIDINSEIRL